MKTAFFVLRILNYNNMWKEENSALIYEKEFTDFNEAWGFLNRVALIAEQQGHHPTIENTFNKVKLTVTTHDAGNSLTDKDRAFADAVNF